MECATSIVKRLQLAVCWGGVRSTCALVLCKRRRLRDNVNASKSSPRSSSEPRATVAAPA